MPCWKRTKDRDRTEKQACTNGNRCFYLDFADKIFANQVVRLSIKSAERKGEGKKYEKAGEHTKSSSISVGYTVP